MARKKRSSYRQPDAASAAAAPGDYKLINAPSDWLNWARPIQWYLDNRLIPIDHWREERTPEERGEDPWVEVLDENDDNTVYQVVSSMIAPSVRKTRSLLDAKKIIIAFVPEENPEATEDDCALAGRALTDIRRRSFDGQIGNSYGEMIEQTMVRGTYFEQSELVTNLGDDEYRDGEFCPIRHTLHDMFDVRWDIGADLNVHKIILRKTLTLSMLPDAYKKKLGYDVDPGWAYERQLHTFEVWTDTHHGVLVAGNVAKEMTPHGYPRCPFTVGMHQPRRVRQGLQAPRSGQWNPWVAYYIGRPVCEDLLQPSEFDSRLMTAMFENVKRTSITPLAGKGIMLREDEDVLDMVNQGFIPLEDTVTSEIQYIPVPDGTSNGLRLKAEHDKRATDTAGATPEQYSGTIKDRTSTSAASDMTSWTRASAEAVRTTVAEQQRRHAMLDVEILAGQFEPSAHRKMQREDPETLAMLGDAVQLDKHDGTPYPGYERLSGQKDRVIDSYTFKFLTDCEIRIPPVQKFDVATGHNVGLQIWNLPPEKSLLSRRTVLSDYLMVPDVEAELSAVLSDELMGDPSVPLGKLLRLKAWMHANAAWLGGHYVAEMDMEIERAMPVAVKQSIQSIVTQFLPAPNLPANSAVAQAQPPPVPMASGGPPPPPGMPPGGPAVAPTGAPPMPSAPPGLLPQGFPPQAGR